MDLLMIGELPFDKKDPINAGVLGYDYVGCAAGVSMHRVRYQCPISGNRYNFVTSLPYMSPGLIAYLYRVRWDIENIRCAGLAGTVSNPRPQQGRADGALLWLLF